MDALAAVAEAAHAAQQQQQQQQQQQEQQSHHSSQEHPLNLRASSGSSYETHNDNDEDDEDSSSSSSGSSEEEDDEEGAFPGFRSAQDDEPTSENAQKRRRVDEGSQQASFRLSSGGKDSGSSDDDEDEEDRGGVGSSAPDMRGASGATHSGNPPSSSSSKQRQQTKGRVATKKGKRTSTNKDPNAPQKPKSAYNFFRENMRDKVKEQLLSSHPHLHYSPQELFSTLSSTLSETWKQMDQQKRQKYEDLAAEDRRRYEEEMQKYKPEPWMDSSGKIHDPNAPKKPLTAFVFFSQARRQAIREARPELPLSEISKQLGHEWNALTEEQKKPYVDMAAEDRSRYQRQSENYRAPRPEDHPEWLATYTKAVAAKAKEKEQKKKAGKGQGQKRRRDSSSKDSSALREFKKEEEEATPHMSSKQKAAMKYLQKRERVIKGYQKHLENLFFDPWKKRYTPSALFLFAERNKGKISGSPQAEDPFKWLVESKESMTKVGSTTVRTQVKNLWDKLEESSRQDYKYLSEVLRDKHPTCVHSLTRYEQGWDRLVKSFSSSLSSADQLGQAVREIYDRKYPIPEVVEESLHPASKYRLNQT